jgi:hypothetical protein
MTGRAWPLTEVCEFLDGHKHKVHIYLEYHSVCSLVRIGTTPTPSPAGECAPHRNQKGGDTLGEVGGPNSDDWRKSLALYLLCEDPYHQYMALCAPQLMAVGYCLVDE